MSGVSRFADNIKIAIMFIKATFRNSKKVNQKKKKYVVDAIFICMSQCNKNC